MSYQDSKLPGFVIGWAIVDLVFCSLRLIQAPLTLLAMFIVPDENSMTTIATVEIVTSSLIALTGIPAALLILCKKRAGLHAGYTCAVLTVVGLLGVILNALLSFQTTTGAELAVAVAAGAFFFLLRVALLVIYCLMLLKFRDFLDQRDETAEEYPIQ